MDSFKLRSWSRIRISEVCGKLKPMSHPRRVGVTWLQLIVA